MFATVEIDLTKGLLDDEFKATKEKVEQKISSSLAYGVQIDSRCVQIKCMRCLVKYEIISERK